MLIHKALADLRELRNEEIDLVGGSGYTSESSYNFTYVTVPYCTPYGCGTVTVPGDVIPDVNTDWV